MRSGETKNKRKFVVASLAKVDDPIESMPGAPFGALVVLADPKFPLKEMAKVAARLLESGCAWATLHAGGKLTARLHDVFDKAIVEHQLKKDPEADMQTSGDTEDSLEEAVRDAVWYGQPTYGTQYSELLVLVIGDDKDKLAEKAEGFAKSVEED
ncbi:MAG: hypothetical protein KF696_04080 [Planctomycetes bacterium]|nr:hypothetical protein [Planctomycetota bacterium]MCW8134150.1 hypothetical protein [Planctomycetota bacterium]